MRSGAPSTPPISPLPTPMHLARPAAALLALAACAPPPPPSAPAPGPLPAPSPTLPRTAPVTVLVAAVPAEAGLAAWLPSRLDSLAEAAVADGTAPAVAIAVGRHGRLVHQRGYGRVEHVLGSPPVTDSTLFDLASLTKPVATATAAMLLEEEGRLSLERPLAAYLPVGDTAKAALTLRLLLSHRGGMGPFTRDHRELPGRGAYLRELLARPLVGEPGARAVYRDTEIALAAFAVEAAAGERLDALLARRVFGPLGMRETGFLPAFPLERIAATEVAADRGGLIWGAVHDPHAWAMGGVAGHAGLFGSVRDLAVFAQMLLNGGEYGGVRLFSPGTVARWTAPQAAGSTRALGWDTPGGASSAGRFFSARSFGHTGYTGTSMWIDPERGVFVVLLTNRVNPTAANQRHVALRRAVGDAVMEAVLDAPRVDWEGRRGGPE
jgi:CubicO group peptidase (beta-lactamase class C family)